MSNRGKNYGGETLVQQQFKEEGLVKNIVKRFMNTGQLPMGNTSKPRFVDISDVPDYQEHLNKVIKANESFYSLPASVRKRFNNDPQQLIDFCLKEENKEEAIKLGLVPAPKKEKPPQKVEIVNKGKEPPEEPKKG